MLELKARAAEPEGHRASMLHLALLSQEGGMADRDQPDRGGPAVVAMLPESFGEVRQGPRWLARSPWTRRGARTPR